MSMAQAKLDDKYTAESGRVYLTGTQALVRLPMLQKQRDKISGLKTGCFISGYRGSPLGAYDMALWQARTFLSNNDIQFQPGVNEDLAATAVWGTQQLNLLEKTEFDGVFGIWYGKGPGVDRCGDAFKHANAAGTSPHGGVLALMGDDHTAKSSTLAHQSEYAMMDAMIPVLSPAGVQEFLDLGLHGFAMSRFSGCWTGFKCVTTTVDSSASVYVDPDRLTTVLPKDVVMPSGGLNIRWPDPQLDQEERLHKYKLAAAQAYARANKIDQIITRGDNDTLGIVAAGKSYLDTRQALSNLDLDEMDLKRLGVRLYKPALVWPLEKESLMEFANGLNTIIIVEEKRGLIEDQIKEILFNEKNRPALVIGKNDETGETLFPSTYQLTSEGIALALAARIETLGDKEKLRSQAQILRDKTTPSSDSAEILRTPYFCSGCPHNTSTKVPEGSRGLSGIGCHFMVQKMNRNTDTYTHMGAEGVTWVGQAPFNGNQHVFVNIGDGTYYHSGFLAIRAAVASGANMTYKVLFNDAVAMTGGQPVDGQISVADITFQFYGEGIRRIAVVSDEPEKYSVGSSFAPGTTIHHRDDLDQVQKELREWEGVSTLIYDQTCASEKRRRRKRGTMIDPPKRAFINEAVCEGCGDCSTTSNCVSVEPLETEFGRKRMINQSTCNKDLSCTKGFCPSFVTVNGGGLRKPNAATAATTADPLVSDLPTPALPQLNRPSEILVTGIGGTGVVTVGALLGMAAHLEGKGCSVLDIMGAAQKGGAVVSHIKIANQPEELHSVEVGAGSADLLLGCDLIVSASPEALSKVRRGETRAIINSHNTPVAGFIHDPNLDFQTSVNQKVISKASGEKNSYFIEATKIATSLFGDSIATNVFMLGNAYQRGLVPISADAIERAIELNGVAVEMNKSAFAWGRLAADDSEAAEAAAKQRSTQSPAQELSENLEQMISRRENFLQKYQDRSYANRYREFVQQIQRAEENTTPGKTSLAQAVAKYAFKLMAYKDEYEVARLHSDPEFRDKIRKTFEGEYKLTFHLAPPLFAPKDPNTGKLKKMSFGPWVLPIFGLLAKLKFLRGSAFDVFGYTAERKLEREMIEEYFVTMKAVTAKLDHESYELAVQIAEIPEKIRGFGHIKEKNVREAKARETKLLESFHNPESRPVAAE
ncbi:MAG: indolepyruvate ferredoxin oxidoreductase family protein [Pseudomonadota bacterium]|nr:indolepyruvate ferredoxin oxidoreductase family protein [Pseudomonadota bacterium]